ncbi:cupin domain-containing protein [Teichococcus wenyumeiae]|uniref:cupin domain-containing protein n=1 Tax=Teichococcus wenyumeiae TaxID=2478470 RepID=UPI001F205248|nr:cupin domain-containing protein [Pseudoroseomonas wenyumeiae]
MTAARFGRLGEGPRPAPGEESFTELLAAGGAVVERILSRAAASPPDFWYDQPQDEFVLLVSGGAALEFPDGTVMHLSPGDYAVLPAHCRHRVAWTEDETLWLAVHLPEGGSR